MDLALFDFDGTISDERVGWPNLIVANNVAHLIVHNPYRNVPELLETLFQGCAG